MKLKKIKKLAAIAACAVVTTTSMISVSASAINPSVTIETITNDTISPYIVSILHLLDGFPCYQQAYGSSDCWAESARAVINYLLSTNYTTQDMKDRVTLIHFQNPSIPTYSEIGGASVETIIALLQSYLPNNSPMYMGALTTNGVELYIDSGYPTIMLFSNSTGTVNHAAALTGYGTAMNSDYSAGIYEGDFTGICFMNPATGTDDFYDYLGTAPFTYNTGSVELEWKNSIVVF